MALQDNAKDLLAFRARCIRRWLARYGPLVNPLCQTQRR